MNLKDKVVIVTGAGSGVGRALALEFGARGARVVCAARRVDRIQETAATIEADGGTALAVQADVTDIAQVERMVSQSLDAFEQINVIFNNAGSFGALGAVWEIDPDLWWNDVTVNLRGTMLCCRAVLPHMLKRDSGIIINMSGGNQIPGGTGYSCSKVGVIRFTELLAKELKLERSSVLAFIMGPGFVLTKMTEIQIETPAGLKWLPSSKKAVEQGRDRQPEDCARATMQLIREACPELSGGTFGPDTDFEKLLRDAKRSNDTVSEHLVGDITIRPFDAERDAERVKEIVGEIWGGGDDALIEKKFGIIGGRPWSEWMSQSVLSYLQDDGARSFVAEQGENVIGFCSYVIDEGRRRGTVGYNGVALDHQRLGIGSAMLDFVMSSIRAEKMEYAGVIVADNEEHAPARRNYEKHGFRRFAGCHYMVQKL